METRGKKTSRKRAPKTKHQLILECWESVGQPVVGAGELKKVQGEMSDWFGETAVDSPATIARVLADAGAQLRHPEVIEYDARWRADRMGREADLLPELSAGGDPLTLATTEVLIERLEQLRTQSDETEVARLRAIAVEAKKDAELRAKRRTLGELQKLEQLEIAEWIGVWLRTPNLFKDWVELRRRSADFQQKFG